METVASRQMSARSNVADEDRRDDGGERPKRVVITSAPVGP